jgi:Protein phosphatase 2C
MRALAQVFHEPRSTSTADEWEDGAAYSERRQCFAVADGATGSFRARDWAEAIVEAYVRRYPALPPDPTPARTEDMRTWFVSVAAAWPSAPDRDGQTPWWVAHKERTANAAATFVGLTFGRSATAQMSWEAVAVGDCCLFHVNGSRLAVSFPHTSTAEFTDGPSLFPADAEQAARAVNEVRLTTGQAVPGDMFVLASDAFSKWLVTHHAADRSMWRRVRALRPDTYPELVTALRRAGEMDDDDTTTMIVHII